MVRANFSGAGGDDNQSIKLNWPYIKRPNNLLEDFHMKNNKGKYSSSITTLHMHGDLHL
jgi:hypothetical protein